MTITHIVSFRYANSVSEAERNKYFDELLALKHTCLRDGKPYIRALVGGCANTSPEGAGKGFDHTFVVTFASADDVKHYLETDDVHMEFASRVKPLLADAFIYDFETVEA
ncbi:hypothetical protein FA09DRAFT_318956 [Tilletiopsis washingtonensis]|uniref:Stress-response A/B barrel domain-containing protein n=1 Tax=Tilletiopsis washingtonensis TaxID=58919 RepID=A0A316ZAK8_9BASI|nr:hypothetical protein FA09DRAFT_318956 [Tilletiopsis washingtonensis]PWN97962.1 hypothetical protein FA09DRAFT_318956 [Tilletiopsis washingtonensis]